MLTKEQRDKWADALESGKYNQTKRKLYSYETNGYCCLGIFGKVVLHLDEEQLNLTKSNNLPYGIMPTLGKLGINTQEFIKLNDAFSNSFHEIAQVVRSLPTSD